MRLRKSKIGLETLKEQLCISNAMNLVHFKFSTEYSCFVRFDTYLSNPESGGFLVHAGHQDASRGQQANLRNPLQRGDEAHK